MTRCVGASRGHGSLGEESPAGSPSRGGMAGERELIRRIRGHDGMHGALAGLRKAIQEIDPDVSESASFGAGVPPG